jgi:hypothetical protein
MKENSKEVLQTVKSLFGAIPYAGTASNKQQSRQKCVLTPRHLA